MNILNASPVWGNRSKLFSVLTILAFTLALTSAPPWGAFAQEPQQTQAQPQTPAQQQATPTVPDIQLTPVSLEGPIQRAEKDGTAVKMSLRDAIKLALQANLDIAIADTKEDSLQWSLTSAKAAWDPTFTSSFSWGDSKSLNFNVYDASQSTINSSISHSWSARVTQPIPTGGSFNFNLGGTRSDNNSAASLANPRYGATWSVSFSQPLLQNFKIDSNRNALKVANLNLKANDTVFKSSVSSVVQSVESAYWDLVSAIGSYEISKAAVVSARTTVEQNTKKRDIGTIAPIDVVISLSSQASREVSLLSSEDTIQSRENALRTLISKDRSSDIWGQTIVPTDQPEVSEYKIDLNTAIATALKNSPTLENWDNTLEQNDLSYQLNLNARKWNFSVNGSFNSGSSGVPEGNKSFPSKLWGGLGTSYLYMFNTTPPSWSFGWSLSIPINHRSNDARLAQDRITKQNNLMSRTKAEQSVIVQVRNQLQQLNTAKKQIDTAEIGVKLSEAQLEAEKKRFDAGLSQNFQVLTAQDNFSSSKNQLLNSKISYRKAILNLQQAMFTLLEANNISTSEIGKSKTTFK